MTGDRRFREVLGSPQRIPFLLNLNFELAMAERSECRGNDRPAVEALRIVAFLNEIRIAILNQLRADTYGANVGYLDEGLAAVVAERVERAGMGAFWTRMVERSLSGLE